MNHLQGDEITYSGWQVNHCLTECIVWRYSESSLLRFKKLLVDRDLHVQSSLDLGVKRVSKEGEMLRQTIIFNLQQLLVLFHLFVDVLQCLLNFTILLLKLKY